jgi:hypothetical protein
MGKIQILEDLTTAVHDYPVEYLTIEVVDLSGFGQTINVNDDVQFRIQVTNSGPLTVSDLVLTVSAVQDGTTGDDNAKVKGNDPTDTFGSSFTTDVFDDIIAHTADNLAVVSGGAKYTFKPKVKSSGNSPVDLIAITINRWTTTFDHITGSHSDANTDAPVVYSDQVERAA